MIKLSILIAVLGIPAMFTAILIALIENTPSEERKELTRNPVRRKPCKPCKNRTHYCKR